MGGTYRRFALAIVIAAFVLLTVLLPLGALGAEPAASAPVAGDGGASLS
jgi:hypothetical protein